MLPSVYDDNPTQERFFVNTNTQAFRIVQEAISEVPAEDLRKKAASERSGLTGGNA